MKILNKYRIKKIALFLMLILFLYSCATNYSDNEKTFYGYLENQYRVYGDYKTENNDWKGARIFYKKANTIRNGKTLEPEQISTVDNIFAIFSQDITYEQLIDMRERMMMILNDNTSKQQYPEEVANLQFYYDCWVLEEELYTRYSQIARCKQGFINTLSYLEFKLLRLDPDEIDSIRKNIDNEVEVEVFVRPKRYVIYFDFDSSALSPDSSRVLWEFLNDAKNTSGKYIVNVVGHADRTGAKKYNEQLSKRRTETIKHYLIKNGIPEDIIKVKWQGEIDPQVITSNDFKETLNRRVVITIDMIE